MRQATAPTLAAALARGTFADALSRPLPTADRTCGHTNAQHQALNGRAADARSQGRAVRELTAERDQARAECRAMAQAAADHRRTAGLALAERDGARQDAANWQRAHTEAVAMASSYERHASQARQLADSLRDDLAAADTVITAARAVTDSDRLSRRALTDLADALHAYDAPPRLGSPSPRAQDLRPATWEQQAIDAITNAWTHVEDDAAITAQRLAEIAVRAIIDAGLAGPGGRCRLCGATYPRTLPAGQDPLCWTCDSEEQTGIDENPA